MNFFRDKLSLYDTYKDRSYGALFMSTILVFIGSLVLGAAIGLFNLQIYLPYLLPGFGLFAAAGIWRAVRRERQYRRDRLKHGPLSRDELRVARSKLQNGMKPFHRPAPRAPDTNLKY